MTKFSKEWVKQEKLDTKSNFSIEREFQKLKEGRSIDIICKGFGISKIIDRDSDCYVKTGKGEEPFEDVFGYPANKNRFTLTLLQLFLIIAFVFGLSWFLIINFISAETTGMGRGAFGDMFGSVNALFSGLALGGIIFTIHLQKKELRLQRKELQETRNEFKIQNETLKLQRFENTFFQMLNLHHEIVDKLEYKGIKEKIEKRAVLKLGKERLIFSFRDSIEGRLENKKKIESISESFKLMSTVYTNFYTESSKPFEPILSHYYRNLYHIFKYIYLSELIKEDKKQFYASLVRAQLSPDELLLIYYNSFVPELGNPKFLFLVQEFDLMQNFNRMPIKKFDWHIQFFENLNGRINNPFNQEEVKAVIPKLPLETK